MKYIKISLALLFVLIFQLAQAQENEKIQLLLVGTYHMDNPGQDVFNLKADDVLHEKRQEEIQGFVDLIAAFEPDKIGLEFRPAYDSLFQASYQAYLDGADLSRDERQQIGFRLAKQLGHEKVYGMDASAPFSMDPVMEWAEKNNKMELVKKMMGDTQKLIDAEQARMNEMPIDEYLTYMNEQDRLNENLRFYHDYLLLFADEESTPGPDLVSDWYKRNARIMANILQTAEPGDKIMLIFGSGHIPVIQQFARISDRVELVDLQGLSNENKN